jgi:hypothetical protein
MFTKQCYQPESLDYLEHNGATCVSLWARSCEDLAGIATLSARGPKHSEVESARPKSVWKKAAALADRRDIREAEGLPTADVDEPLLIEAHRDVVNTAAVLFNLSGFDSATIGVDTPVGRCHRASIWPSNCPCSS